MALKPASSLPVPTRDPPIEYVAKRIQSASDNGYASTKAWVRMEESKEVVAELEEAGYKVDVIKEESSGIQLNIAW